MTTKPPSYRTGEVIQAGDHVLYCGHRGHVEFVVDATEPTPEHEWYAREFGSGAMVAEPECFGHVFVTDLEDDEDLQFLERSGG